MHVVVALVSSLEDRNALHEATVGRAELRPCARARELAELADRNEVSAVVAELHDATGASAAHALLALQRERPTLPIVITLSLTPAEAGAVGRLGAAGLQARWEIRGYDRLATAVRAALDGGTAQGAAAAILSASAPVVRPPARALLVAGALCATRPITVREAAGGLKVSVRTLDSWCHEARLPPPRQILGWCRALHAVWHLDVLGQKSTRVVAELGFASTSALSHLVARVTGGSTPREVRQTGGFSPLLDRFVAVLGPAGPARGPG